MQLIIEIPDDYIKVVMANQRTEGTAMDKLLRQAVIDGEPLPKGHGRLIILSEEKLKENQINLDFSFQKWIGEVDLSNAMVAIIEADKGDDKC